MSEREFQIELCNRAVDAHRELLDATCRKLRAEADAACAKATVESLTRQIEILKIRDSFEDAA
jgi:hypothetical protein